MKYFYAYLNQVYPEIPRHDVWEYFCEENAKRQLEIIDGFAKRHAEAFAVYCAKNYFLKETVNGTTWVEFAPIEEDKRSCFSTTQLWEKFFTSLIKSNL